MGNKVRAVLGAVLVVMIIGAGCSDGDGEERDGAADDTRTEASDGSDQQDADATDATDTTDDAAPPDDAEADDDLVDPGDIDVPEGSDPDLRQEYIDAIVGGAETSEASGFDTRAAECMATAFVDAAGTDALVDAGITPQELADAQESPAAMGLEFAEGAGDVFYDELSTCVDVRELILSSFDGEEDTATAECIGEALDDDMIKDYIVGIIVEGLDESDPELAPTQQRITEAVEPCLSADAAG